MLGISLGAEKNKKMSSIPSPLFVCFFSGIAHFKITDLNWSYKALAQKEALTLCQDRAFASFLCVLSLFYHIQEGSHIFMMIPAHWEEEHRSLEGKQSLPFSHIPNIYIWSKYIVEDRGKSTALQHFINCF